MTRRILVIDDEEAIHVLIQAALELIAGWQVIAASSAAAGLEKAQALQPDAILLDVMMPGVDGPTAFRQLQATPATQQIPVILLTAKARNGERRALEALGVAGVITKPFEPELMASQIATLLQWSD
ncbi:MAG: response regulator [Cyanobacteria bacterium J06626_23]